MKYLKTLFLLLLVFSVSAQEITERPKLVVGVMVDQMKQEYLTRYYSKFGEGGFKRLVEQGFMARNGHYNYVPTSTGPGHASVYTGTTPANHGVINNAWYSPVLHRSVYCAEDTAVTAVGGSADAGQISPRNLYSTTITDELKIFTENRAKVIAMSIKDRGSALPGGRFSDGSYWYDGDTGEFMTSTFYMDALPDWVAKFNGEKHPQRFAQQTWNTLLPIDQYIESGPDDSPYEAKLAGKDAPTFPYDLSTVPRGTSAIRTTPFGNTLLADFALAALDAENLGEDDVTDFLAVSFSSPDYIGHSFGPHSIEVQDTYLRLDRDLARMLDRLDQKLGAGNYVVFLTADHGVGDNSKRLHDQRFRSNNFRYQALRTSIDEMLKAKYGDENWIESGSGAIILDRALVASKGVDRVEMQRDIAQKAQELPGVYKAFTAFDLATQNYTQGISHLVQNAYHTKESPDVLVVLDPGWQGGGSRGTSHGTGWTYDTHVPIIFYGWGVSQGSSVRYMTITDIAPTVSMLLNMRLPSAATGQPIQEVFK